MEIPCKPLQLAMPLPKNPDITIHIHLTFFATSTMVYLTSTATQESASSTPMGSFVYAMPNVAHFCFAIGSLANDLSDLTPKMD
jgi:Proteasome assembly chaperone 4